MRIETLRNLDLDEFKGFWGYPEIDMNEDERKKVFGELNLSEKSREFNFNLFEKNKWKSLLYLGKWEQTIKKLSRINKLILGKKRLELFNQFSLEEQEIYLKTDFPRRAWSLVVFLLGNAKVFNALLYKGSFPKKNINGSMFRFYSNAFERLFKQDIARNNFLLQLLFLGKLKYKEGLPLECNAKIYYEAKKGLSSAKINYIHGDIINEASCSKRKIDFLSLSDVSSYLESPIDKIFLKQIRPRLSKGAVVVNRYYLRIPRDIDTNGYKEITDQYSKLINKEKTQMYKFGIYKNI